jgi:hypothetical protein
MFVNATGLGQINPTRVRPGTRVLRIPINMRRRGMGQTAAQAMVPGTNCTLADSPLGCSPSGIPWQASGGGPANNWIYYDSVTGQPLDLSNACYVNGNLLVNCSDNEDFGGGPPKPAGPISILAQTPAYAAAVAAANAAYVPPPAPGPTQVNPNASNPSFWDVITGGTSSASGAVTATLQNTSRPGQSFQVGDSWQLTVTGPANSPVSDTATQNGNSMGTTPYGSTNGSGVFTLTGAIGASQVGTWSETWSVGGVSAPAINFTVSAAPSSSGGSGGSSSSSGSSSAASSSSTTTATPAGCFAPLAALGIPDPCLGPIGMTTLAVGVVGLIVIASMMGGKK